MWPRKVADRSSGEVVRKELRLKFEMVTDLGAATILPLEFIFHPPFK
jgi:hypothetical protein